MKIFVFLASIVLVTTAIFDQESWKRFKLNYGKGYKSLLDEKRRYTIFQENLRTIEDHNAKYENGEITYKLGVNQFADMTREEFSNQLRLRTISPRSKQNASVFIASKNLEIPNEVDWRQKGAVTNVKNQGNCGSCWAFSTVGALEGQNFLANGKLISLSPQELVDCDRIDAGCNGGLMDTAFDYVGRHGLESEESYPYTGSDGVCKHSDGKIVVRGKGFVDVDDNEDALQAAVAIKGPIAVAVDANGFHLYSSGIFKDSLCSNYPFALNHGVLVVGYGSSNGQDYWTIKNSWGVSWGEDGYMRLARNADNHCGVADEASYPIVASTIR